MDDFFLPFSKIVEKMTDIEGEIRDDGNGIRSHIYEFEIDSPIELDVFTDEDGSLQIGTVPPLYYVNTTFRPSYHRIRFTAEQYKP